MTQTSYYWDGTTIGDATLAPVSNLMFHKMWRLLFMSDRTVQGVLQGYGDELIVHGVSGGISVGTGIALVDGMFYENDKKVVINIPTPLSSTRIDAIVLRRAINDGTIRVYRVPGTEGGGAPTITQIDSGTWDIRLANVSITTGGIITVTDFRQYIVGRMFDKAASHDLIKSIHTVGGEEILTFADIPQSYTHLFIQATGSAINIAAPPGSVTNQMILNDDETTSNYAAMTLRCIYTMAPTLVASPDAAGISMPYFTFLPEGSDQFYQGNGECFIPFYTSSYYKNGFIKHGRFNTSGGDYRWEYLHFVWENTSAITKIEIATNDYFGGTGNFSGDCIYSLYGIR